MASYSKKGYTAKSFKKERTLSAPPDLAPKCPPGSNSEVDIVLSNEDKLISRLYREVVDEIMSRNNLREMTVDKAIEEMKQEIHQGHRRGFRRFLRTDFSRPENRCAYLRRYAVCHTGLVKQLIGGCFSPKVKNSKKLLEALKLSSIRTQPHLKVVSLGGGPGNDLVGFCTALQEIGHTVQELDMCIIDVDQGWNDLFPMILRKASRGNFGSFSTCTRAFKIKTGFMAADLMASGIFKNKKLLSTLAEADLVFMVKLTSFLPDKEAGDLIQNVSNSMKPEAKLIFIDQPYDGDFFRGVSCLSFVCHDYLKYELSFNPARYKSPSIQATQAHIGIYEKEYDLLDSESD